MRTSTERGCIYLSVSGICVKDVGEEFTGAGDASDDKAVDVVAVDYEELRQVAWNAGGSWRGRDLSL